MVLPLRRTSTDPDILFLIRLVRDARLFVFRRRRPLSRQGKCMPGDILQVYTHPVEGQIFGDSLCCFDGKLLAPVRDRSRSGITKEVVALCGV